MTLHVPPTAADAIAVMLQTRGSLVKLLDAYAALCERTGESHGEKLALVEQLSLELTFATQVEEELLLPAMREAGCEFSALQEMHDSAWALVAQLSMGEPGEARFDGRLLLLGRELMQHLDQVHGQTLPQLLPAPIDLRALGDLMTARYDGLMAQFRSDGEDESDDPVGRPVRGELR